MKDDPDVIRTPKGAKLGRRVLRENELFLEYKSGKVVDYLDIKYIVESITGLRVKEIIFDSTDQHLQ